MMNYGGWGWGWAIVCMVAVIAIIVAVVWAIMRPTSQRGPHDVPDTVQDDALTTLQRRYASGEIDDNEYQRRRNLLTQH